MKNLFNIRNLLIAAFILVIILAAGYKYYEWSTIQNLTSLYNQTWSQELGLVQIENKNEIPLLELEKKVFAKNAKSGQFLSSYNELNGDLQLVIGNREAYISAIKQNSNLYSNINTTFLFGQRGDFAKKLISYQEQYYNYEINDSDITDAEYWLLYNINVVFKDMASVTQFNSDVSPSSPTTISKYFTDLAPLQKYTDNSFQFSHEDLIKEYFSNSYDMLEKYKEFYSTFYSTTQDFVNGNYQSAAYVYPTLQANATSLNFDYSNLFSQQDNHLNDNASNIINIVANESNIINNFNAQKLYRYPLLPNTGPWKVNLVLCQLYNFKSGLYHSITNNYVSAKNTSSLINELSAVSPNTQLIDGGFDKSSLTLVNNDKEIQFTCKDKIGNTSYQFVTLK